MYYLKQLKRAGLSSTHLFEYYTLEGKNRPKFGRFLTTLDFDRKYLGNGSKQTKIWDALTLHPLSGRKKGEL